MNEESIFYKATQIKSPAERQSYLDEACGDDIELRNNVESLLAHAEPDSFFENVTKTNDSVRTADPSIQQLGEFEIIRELGRGGMGIVYEAHQKSLNRRVALKVLSAGLGLTSRAVMRFRREAEAAGKLHHTNIVPIYSTGEDKGIHFYAMEMVDGPSLDQIIRHMKAGGDFETGQNLDDESCDNDSQPLPDWVDETIAFDQVNRSASQTNLADAPSATASGSSVSQGNKFFDRVATMIADVADALQHAHDHGVISRDIKPSNLLLGSDGRLSVSDFGLARVLEQPGMTITGEMVGTPRYMSPEQISAGRSPLDHRTDIYSLGATLYEMLTLRPPFNGQSRDEVIGQILHKEPKSPRSINRRIPKDLETICLKAIDRDPEGRYQHASKFAQDLRAFLNRHAISARRLGPIGKTIKFARRNPLATSFIAFVLLTIISAIIGFKIVHDNQREAERLATLKDLQDELIDDVFRGVTKNADDLIRKAIELQANNTQIQFMSGIEDFFKQRYGEAIDHFDKVLAITPEHIPAKSLRAVATHHQGDEYGYFEELQEIEVADASSFEDKFFLGFAHNWGDSSLAETLLVAANNDEPNHLYVRFLLGIARRNIATLIDLNVDRAKEHIDQAYSDIATVASQIRTPLVLRELTWVRIDRIRINRELVALGEFNDVESLNNEIERMLKEGTVELDEILSFEDQNNEDIQYALVSQLVFLSGEDNRFLGQLNVLTDSWVENGKSVHIYSAQTIALFYAALKDYDRARNWTGRFPEGRSAHSTRFVKLLVELVHNETSFAELKSVALENVERKLNSGQTEYLGLDVLMLYFFGVDELHHYADDRLDQIIGGGKVYAPHLDYFRDNNRDEPSRARLLSRCKTGPAPNVALMHANFALGMEALGNESLGDERTAKARHYFEQVQKGRQHLMYVHLMSRVLLEHKERWPVWMENRDPIAGDD